MSCSMFIQLDKSEPDFDSWQGYGVAFAEYANELTTIAQRLGIKAPDDFLSVYVQVDPEDPESGLDDDGNPLPENWFMPDEGLTWVTAIRNHLKANLNQYKTAGPVLEDLDFFDQVLRHAQATGAKWQFMMDF